MNGSTSKYEALTIKGLPDWYVEFTPAAFWTLEAFGLFEAARKAHIIAFDEYFYTWTAGPEIPKAVLAYFCKRASKQLDLNKHSHTNWKPFETMFNSGSYDYTPGPLRLCLHDLEFQGGKKDRIDRFFTAFAASSPLQAEESQEEAEKNPNTNEQ